MSVWRAATGVRGSTRGTAWALGWVLASCVCFAPAHVRAEVWGYVDARGVAHLAAEKLDDRYELFSRGRSSFAMGESKGDSKGDSNGDSRGEVAAAPPEPDAAPALSPQLTKFFETSAGYRHAQPLLRDAARSQGVDYELLKALIVAESGFDPKAVSPKGAIGLMQVMPATAERWGVRGDAKQSIEKKLADPQLNVRTGTRYLRHLMGLFPDRLDLALAAYNAGEGAVQRAGNRVPNYRETQNYVKTVMHLYAMLKPPPPVRVAPVAAPAPARRVRMELPGQVPGRASMPPPLTAPSATPND
jgi:soluble lytic murein transglycosylase-like protein